MNKRGKTVSASLKEQAIYELEFLKSSLDKQEKTAFDFLKETGFIGAAEGEKQDSTGYKKYVTQRIKQKL